MLAGAGGAHDLLGVLRVRCAEHDALHVIVLERIVEGPERQLLLARELRRRRQRIGDAHNAQLRAALDQRDDDAAPPAETDNGDVQHQSGVAPASRAIFAQRSVSAATYFWNSAGLALVMASAPPFFRRLMTSGSFITCVLTANRRSITSCGVPVGT